MFGHPIGQGMRIIVGQLVVQPFTATGQGKCRQRNRRLACLTKKPRTTARHATGNILRHPPRQRFVTWRLRGRQAQKVLRVGVQALSER